MRRQFRPSLGRPQSDKKGDVETPTTSNETLSTQTPPTRRARIKPKVGIVGNSRNGGPFARRSQTKTSAAVVPSIVVPLVPEKEVNNLLKTSTQSSGIRASDAQSDDTFQEKTHGVTTRDVGGDGTQGCTMAELEASTPHAQEENLSTVSTQSKEDTQNGCSSEVPSAKPVLQLELCIPVLIEKTSLLLEDNTTSESLQSTGRSNAVAEENTPEFTGSVAEVTVDSHLSDSNLYFNADDFLQNLLQNEHPHDADVIADVMADLHQSVLTNSEVAAVSQLSVTNKLPENIDSSNDSTFEKRSNPQTESYSTRSDDSSLPIFDKQSEKVIDRINGDSTTTSSNNATETSSRLVVKRRRKPRNNFPQHVDVASQLEFSAPPQMLDITEIPIASIVEIDLDLCDSGTHEIDHPVLELPDDLIQDNVDEVHPEERQGPLKVFRRGFRKKKFGAVKHVVSRRSLGSLKDSGTAQDTLCEGTVLESRTIAEGKEGRKDETVKKKKVGPNLSQARKRTRSQPVQTSHAMPQPDGGIRRPDRDEVENHDSDNVVEEISESIQVEDGHKQAEKEDSVDGSKISECHQTEVGDSLTDVVKIPKNRQAEEGDSLTDVVKISENHQAEDGGSLTDVVKIPNCRQAEDGDSLDDVVRIPDSSQDEGDSLMDVVRIPECRQAEDGDSLTDVVKIPEFSQDEDGESLTDVVKISDSSQDEDGDSLTNVIKIAECRQPEHQCSMTSLPALSNILEDISLSITDDTMGGILNHNNSEPLSSVVECPYTDIITCATSTTSNIVDHTERTSSGNKTPEDNSTVMVAADVSSSVTDLCIAEAGSRSNEAEKQPKPKGIRRKRKTKGKAGSEVAQGVTEGLQESQEVGDPTAVSEEGSDSVTCGKKRKLSKPKPKIPAKRGRKKATCKEPANVTEETATTAESEPGTDGPNPVKEGETSIPPSEKAKCDNTAPQKKKRGRPPSSKNSTDSNKQKDDASTETVTKKKSKRQAKSEDLPSVNISTMKISAMAYYNPKTNPMKSPSVEETQENIRVQAPSTQASEPEIILTENEGGEEEQQPAILAPQVRIDADGNVVLDEESLLISTSAAANNDSDDREVVYESTNQQYRSTIRRKYMDRWNKEETLHFYEILSQIGTDFSLMATLFPKRNRTELKKKFKKEEKQNRDLIEKALNQRNPIPASLFAKLLEETEEEMEQALAVSPQQNAVQA